MHDPLIGQTIGNYTIQSVLGRGGMSVVYLAQQTNIERQVAVKIMPSHLLSDLTFVQRFEREVALTARLEHPRILAVYDYGVFQDRPYIVTAYMSGGTLADRIRRGPVPVDEATRLIDQIAEGLDYAHGEGVIHRDFKPSNVLLDRHGNTHLADFGIAKISRESVDLTGSRVIGTLLYMAPEMFRKEALTPAVDIYAVGVTVYQMLTGEFPFQGDTSQVIAAHLHEPPPDICSLRPDLPIDVRRVIERAMAKDPAHRYPTVGQLAQDLRTSISASPTAVQGAWAPANQPTYDGVAELPFYPPPPQAPVRRGIPAWLGVGAGLIGLLCVAGICAVVGLTVSRGGLGGGGLAALLAPEQVDTPDRHQNDERNQEANPDDETAETSETPTPTRTPEQVAQEAATGVGISPAPPPTSIPTPIPSPTPLPTAPPNSGGLSGRIVFTCFDGSFDQVCVMNADGSNEQQLTNVEATNWYASIAPDGRAIAFSTRRDSVFEIYLMGMDGSSPTRLTSDLGANFSPTISPDGSRIVFASTAGTTDNRRQHIWVMGIDGSNPRQISFSEADEVDAAWSPDGQQVLFASNRTDTMELYVMDADGSNVRQLTIGMDIGGRNDWSRVGNQITFYAGPDDGRQIYIMNADGSNIRQLTSGSDNLAPSFSPDGQWITFTSWRDGDLEIHIMRSDGSDLRQITHNSRADWQPRWGP